MSSLDPQSARLKTVAGGTQKPENPELDVAPPIGDISPNILARDAAAGRRGAAWRLLVWVLEHDPRAEMAVASLDDDRLTVHLLEFIGTGTWAGKPFVVPVQLRSAYARRSLQSLFMPDAGMDPQRELRILQQAMRDPRSQVRETAAHILGYIKAREGVPALIKAVQDPVPPVRRRATRALGRIGDPSALPALTSALSQANEQDANDIFMAFTGIGRPAVPTILQLSNSNSARVRWHCMHALGEIGDARGIPTLAQALHDQDQSVQWMASKSLVRFGSLGVGPVLHLLVAGHISYSVAQIGAYVLAQVYRRSDRLQPYLEPVVEAMHSLSYPIATPLAAQKALAQLEKDKIITA